MVPRGTRSVSLFLVNRRKPAPDEVRDTAFAFQAALAVRCEQPFVSRPNLRGLESDDWDERVADLQYRDVCEFAVGHGVATRAVQDDRCECREVHTRWIPAAEVERVAPAPIEGVELAMEKLATLPDAAAAKASMGALVSHYRAWLGQQQAHVPAKPRCRKETATELLSRAGVAADRIEAGIELLKDPKVLEAFRTANKVMAVAARRRFGTMRGLDPAAVDAPAWRPLQLAFLLMNLKGIVEPAHPDREVVDLLFFPTSGGKRNKDNPADPYMTLLGYFNSLRELGGSRRIVEDEVSTRLSGYANRKREGQADGPFAERKIAYEVVELTSRVSTDKVAEAKRRLAVPFHDDERVDVAIGTNMISVGLDITRLGLMVVLGQPKASAEYIQATSRVGRGPDRPGLVVTILNVHRPRDRSHCERFAFYHQSFYRSVEATSVTPFSPRALDRGLAGTLVALTRQAHAPMTPPRGATEILRERGKVDFVIDASAHSLRRPLAPLNASQCRPSLAGNSHNSRGMAGGSGMLRPAPASRRPWATSRHVSVSLWIAACRLCGAGDRSCGPVYERLPPSPGWCASRPGL
jgi:hypothetical protein